MPLHRVLVVGVGSIGERHVRCFGRTGRARLSICEINDELRETVRQRYDLQVAHATLDDALTDDLVDAAVICTPAHLHIPIALQLADHGLHLLIEKPLSTSLDDIETLQQKIERGKLLAAVAYPHRANPIIQGVKTVIDSGRIGTPKQITCVGGQHFPTFRPAYREIYYTRRQTGGGAIRDAMTHSLNLGEFLVGPIDRLAADADHLVLEGVSVEDTVHVVTRHGPVMGSYCMAQFAAPNSSIVTVNGDQGTIQADLVEEKWRVMDQINGPWRDQPAPSLERDEIFTIQANSFLDTIEGKSQPLCTLCEGLHTLQADLAVLRAADEHTWQFVGP